MTKHIQFTKMHGLGNDFVVINGLSQNFTLSKTTIQQLADRHLGIGFDQLLIIESAKNADFFCRIFNADGSEAEQCGNGLRCVARFLHEKNLIKKNNFTVATLAGIFPVMIQDYQHISVQFNLPALPTKWENSFSEFAYPIYILSLGNPHAIVRLASIDGIPIAAWAKQISSAFTDGINIGFMQIISPQHIRLRTYERGADETHACGSNAVAAAVSGIFNGWLEQTVQVEFRYGSLSITWPGAGEPINMMGPAEKVFDGSLSID